MDPVIAVTPLGFVWKTKDPFLFCVHHQDAYPAGNDHMGPATSLQGRDIGQDFAGRDGWNMYHGVDVPGFPQHPHRGFETVTIVRSGLIDHSDSLGATARFGSGDVQWLTAGKGIVHCEMFPLVEQGAGNPAELFQIWLNLPSKQKMVDPHFSMLWDSMIPTHAADGVQVRVIAGCVAATVGPKPPPESWASQADADVAIWTIRLAPHAQWTVPPARAGINRTLYVFAGNGMRVAGHQVVPKVGVDVQPDQPIVLQNGDAESEVLLLQGKPIGEPVVQHGPFVMNSPEQIQQAFADYRRTRFGGWPWSVDGPVHPRQAGRFAKHANGKTETPLAATGNVQ